MRPIPIQTASRPAPSPVSSLCRAAHLPTLLRGVAASLPLLALTAGCEETKNITSGPGLEDPGELPPDGIDTDGDGLSDREEAIGWNIAIDDVGFGPSATADQLTVRLVTSDQRSADTDGDGLSDADESRFKTDPRTVDTDGDGIRDRDEVFRWHTSPVSVDTDADARGPDNNLPPNPMLFDGSECEFLHTSPSLVDTDGDGRTDFEEADHSLRSALISDLPDIAVNFEGEVDIRLFVEFEEMMGQEVGFESTLSASNTTSNSTSTAVTTGGGGGSGLLGMIIEGAASGGAKGALTAVAKGAGSLRGVKDLCDFYTGQNAFNTFVSGLREDSNQRFRDMPGAALLTGQGINLALRSVDGLILDGCAGPPEPPVTTTTVATTTSSTTDTYRDLQRQLQSMTETSSRGQVKVGARIRNQGLIAFALSDLFVTMSQWQTNPGPNAGMGASLGTGGFRTLATLYPMLETIVLGPGDSTPVIEFLADDVNPEIVKGFLAHPGSIFYSPAGFELSNAGGINFDFLTEEVIGRTADVTIDYGGGAVDRYSVATNVRRYSREDELACAGDPDCDGILEGELAGLRMGDLFEIIGVPYRTTTRMVKNGAGALVEVQVLDDINGRENIYPEPDQVPDRTTGEPGAPSAFWMVSLWTPEQARVDLDFEDIVVEHGQSIRFVYVEDQDGDGLYRSEEDVEGTLDSSGDSFDNVTWASVPDGIPDSVDSDRDGLSDFAEVKLGWRVCFDLADYMPGLPGPDQLISFETDCTPGPGVACYSVDDPPPCYWAYSDPRTPDTDGDGNFDDVEKIMGTDPNNGDTDFDLIADKDDDYPRTPAVILHVNVNQSGPDRDGTSWATAFQDLQDALTEARRRNNPESSDESDDVSQIWVAQGIYNPGSGQADHFDIPRNVSIYGGFQGRETRLGQRDSNPLTNGTILSGDVEGDDVDVFASSINDPTVSDNNSTIVSIVNDGSGDRPVSVVDGFVITGGTARGSGANQGEGEGGGILVQDAAPVLRNLFFRLNQAEKHGGAIAIHLPATAAPTGRQPIVEACIFDTNRTFDSIPSISIARGGAVYINSMDPGRMTVRGCEFSNNHCTEKPGVSTGLGRWAPSVGGGLCFFGNSIEVTDSNFTLNGAHWGGGLYLDGGLVGRCAFNGNETTFSRFNEPGTSNVFDIQGGSALMTGILCPVNDSYCPPQPAPDERNGKTLVTHCVFWENKNGDSHGFAWQPNLRGVLVGNRQNTNVRSCTFVKNASVSAIGNASTVANSVMWNNATGSFFDYYLVSSVSYCCFSLGSLTGVGNTQADPKVIGDGNLRIGAGSSCIDKGSILVDFDTTTPGFQGAPAVDLDGNPRVRDGVIDIGAYEFQPSPP